MGENPDQTMNQQALMKTTIQILPSIEKKTTRNKHLYENEADYKVIKVPTVSSTFIIGQKKI